MSVRKYIRTTGLFSVEQFCVCLQTAGKQNIMHSYNTTSRDRPKSAPYPRLKNSRKTSKCQVLFYSTRKSKFFEKKIFEKNYSKKWTKNLTMPKKTERGDPLGFFNIHSVAKHQKKCRGDPLGKNFIFRKKCLAAPKKMKGGSLWSRPVWYVTRKNRKNLFGSVR